jgi:bifunctional UDP-N-acetylglucosamine pyrophosphorylase/glucosamine-1-phosphate N-acetyltransferase/UDP-N-acetylglucosamine pyrophosphorylase
MAIVLAAGKGTRMKTDLPKVLVPALGRPIITYVLDALRQAGVGRITIVVGYRQELVREALSGYADLDFAQQTEQLGTGHAVMCCRATLEPHRGPVVIVAGDSPMLQATSLRRLLATANEQSMACLLGTLHSPDPTGLGRIVRDPAGNFTGIVEEKDATEQQRKITEVNMSTYVFDAASLWSVLEAIDNRNRQGEYYLTDYPAKMLERGMKVDALPVLQPIEALSINTMDQLAAVEAAMQKQQL